MPGTRRILQPRNKRQYPSVFHRYISDKETFLYFGPKTLLFRKQIQLHVMGDVVSLLVSVFLDRIDMILQDIYDYFFYLKFSEEIPNEQ